MFKRRRFPVEIILLCVRWYCKYGISYRDLAEMMQERGVEVDPSTLLRWVQRYAPELEKRVRAYQGYGSTSWRVDETYIKVGGRWKYLFRAVDKHGVLIDFMLLDRRNSCAAHRFLSKAATTMRNWPPSSITTDKCPSYPEAIARLKRDGQFSEDTRHRTSKYLNNIIDADHGPLKQIIKPTRGFQTMKTASATIKGFEIMRMIRRGHCLTCKRGVQNEALRQLAVRDCRLTPEIEANSLRLNRLMQQSPLERAAPRRSRAGGIKLLDEDPSSRRGSVICRFRKVHSESDGTKAAKSPRLECFLRSHALSSAIAVSPS